MALSQTFLKQAEAANDQVKSTGAKREQEKEFLTLQAAPLFETLNALAALPRDKDGYKFDYFTDYSEISRTPEFKIFGSYKNEFGNPKRYGGFINWLNQFDPLESKFHIVIRRGESRFAQTHDGVEFKGTARDLQNGADSNLSELATTAQYLADGFLAKWTGRNIPDVAARLQARKEEEALPPVQRAVQKLKKFALGAFG